MHLSPFTDEHLEAAAGLLSARHRAQRAARPALPAAPEQPAVARQALEALLRQPRTSGVAALQAGRLVGFALGYIQYDTLRGRTGWLPAAGHAIAEGVGRELYGELYTALATHWVQAGCFSHFAVIPTTDREALETWYALGFGQQQLYAVRELAPLELPAQDVDPSIRVRRASLADLDLLLDVAGLVFSHQQGAPVFSPFLPEFTEDWRKDYEELLTDDANHLWIAERGSRALGFSIFGTPKPSPEDLLTPPSSSSLDVTATRPELRGQGIARALVARGLEESVRRGCRTCVTDWRTTNLLASRFWPRMGFAGTVCRLFRQVDERVAWAHRPSR